MAPFLHPNPTTIGIELFYSLIVIVLCILVYIKTKNIYDLTKHKGISIFRNTFLFFGLAYASRFILHLVIIGFFAFDIFIPRKMLMPISHLIVAYFSTMALLYLAYSTCWKKVKSDYFQIFSNIIALFVSIVAFVSRSPMITSIIQLGLVLTSVILITKKKSKNKVHNIKTLYILIAFFWLINLFVLRPKRCAFFEIKTVLQIISIVVFVAIYYKVQKVLK